jgi:hypothetical protein
MPKRAKSLSPMKPQPVEETKPSIKPLKFTYDQNKKLCEFLQNKLNIAFWMLLSKDKQEEIKTDKNQAEEKFYRLGVCKYGDSRLLNILRYFPMKEHYEKTKAYATINLNSMKSTQKSQHKIELTEKEMQTLKTIIKD